MNKTLKFSHKILLAASLIVIAAFASFTLYNDYLQRNAIRDDLNNYLQEMGNSTATNIQNWLSGRILLVENVAQTIANNPEPATVTNLLGQKVLASTFDFAYLGDSAGKFISLPVSELPADYDPRTRPWYKGALTNGSTILTEPPGKPGVVLPWSPTRCATWPTGRRSRRNKCRK